MYFFAMTLNNTLYINVVSYFYASVNSLFYINCRGPFVQSQITIQELPIHLYIAYSPYRLQHKTLKTLTKGKEIKSDSMVNM